MAENSKIEWTHHTLNPWIGCTKVSAACDNCYAEAWDNRFQGARWGAKAARTRTKDWSGPMRWDRKAKASGTRLRVFCASLADVFDNHRSILPEWRTDLWELIKKTPNLDWLLLTKRPQNIEKYLPDDWGDGYPNVWLGITIEDNDQAKIRMEPFLKIPAIIHFISVEPMLGELNLDHIHKGYSDAYDEPIENYINSLQGFSVSGGMQFETEKIDWVIVGGENARDYRPMNPDWVRSLRDQCSKNDTPLLFKQWSGRNRGDIIMKGRAIDGFVHNGYPEIKRVNNEAT